MYKIEIEQKTFKINKLARSMFGVHYQAEY